jgi:hypothetical protein
MQKGWAISVLALRPVMIYCAFIMNIGIESNDSESGESALKAATVQRTLHVTEMGSSVDSADEELER